VQVFAVWQDFFVQSVADQEGVLPWEPSAFSGENLLEGSETPPL